MAISIDKLAQDKELQAQGIINKLDQIDAEANKYAKELGVLEAEIDSAKSKEELFQAVKQIIHVDRAVGGLLSRDEDVIKIIRQRIQNAPHAESIITLLNFLSDDSNILDKVMHAKERILEKQLYEKLSEGEKRVAMNYIQDVKALKSDSEYLDLQKNDFRTRLEEAATLDEVSAIESEINKKHHECILMVRANVRYPENNDTAGLLIEFMDSNPHLLSILQSFDFDESLSDNVLHARGRLSLPSP
ncbi:hypothetical protein [Legionella shakespearei]|uniref:Coiled coil protein n=1 Tax=Legionella shakespearei DSM 23087 TaxID=1122169 RepID=A0A0W0YLZ3_9GAMM|nr:hypothetical protein [Legionella shakespearei]KTD57542.1 hypothetical protein Lsha_2383 [Legionella shakespearei DSM 23087]